MPYFENSAHPNFNIEIIKLVLHDKKITFSLRSVIQIYFVGSQFVFSVFLKRTKSSVVIGKREIFAAVHWTKGGNLRQLSPCCPPWKRTG